MRRQAGLERGPAAGGLLLTDAQEALAELFDPESKVAAYYLEHPEQRIAITRRAQKRIAAHHTHSHRLQTLEVYLRERCAH